MSTTAPTNTATRPEENPQGWPGNFPPPGSTSMITLNVQYHDWPLNIGWSWEKSTQGATGQFWDPLAAVNGTLDLVGEVVS